MEVSQVETQATAPTERQSGAPIGERVAKLEGAYEHLATKADFHALRTEIEKVRTEVESVRTEVESVRTEVESVRTEVETVRTEVGSVRADLRANRWLLSILIAAASVGVAVVNVLVTLALRT